jgi:Defence against restriction A N-terminal
MKLMIDYGLLGPATVDRAVRTVRRDLEKFGATVVDVSATGKEAKAAGQAFKEVLFVFADSQTIGLRVKPAGDVYQVLVNGKVTPVREQDDGQAAIKELVAYMGKTRTAFQRRMAAKAMKPPDGMKTAAPRMEAVLRQQVAEVDAQIADAEQELASLEAE